jgi:spermidine/putrescine transport system permease protein
MRISQRLEALLLAPLAVLLLGAIVFPAVILLGYSLFLWVSLQATGGITLTNYIESLTDPLYRQLAINTIAIALPTTLASVAGGFAVAYHVVFVQQRGRSLMFALVVSALMASYIVRIFAWRTMLGERGIINSALVATGLIGQPLDFLLFSRTSAILAEAALFMPLAALAFYASLSGISGSYREAAWDLGAGRLQEMWRITLPLSGPSILATTTLIFFLSAGDYVTPVMVGGADSTTIGTAIAASMGRAADYGLGSAVSFVTLLGFAVCFVLIRAVMRAAGLLPVRAT